MNKYSVSALTLGVGMFAGALLLQGWLSLMPCPLCIVQRIEVLLASVGIICYMVSGSNTSRAISKAGAAISAIAGIGTSMWHEYIAELATKTGSGCGVSLSYAFDNLPLKKVLSFIFFGSGDCSEIGWKLLNFISIPSLSMFSFIILMGLIYNIPVKNND